MSGGIAIILHSTTELVYYTHLVYSFCLFGLLAGLSDQVVL